MRALLRQALAARQHERTEGGRNDGDPPATVLIIVDQFEELFLAIDEDDSAAWDQREAFLAVLDEAVTGDGGRGGASGSPAVLVAAIRSDFLDAAAAYPFLRTAVQAGPFLVGPMSEEELHAAVTGPAAEAGMAVETSLVDAVLHDLRDTATTVTGFGMGALPLLSQAMFNT